LTGPFRVGPQQKNELLALLQSDPRICAWPGSGKTARFWHRSPQDVAISAALEFASQRPLDAPALVRGIVKAAYRYPREGAKTLVDQLVREHRLYEDPPWGRKRKISASRPDPERYRAELDAELIPILEKYAALGITPQTLVETICAGAPKPAPQSAAETIIRTLDRIEPRKGLVVAVSKVRHAPELDGMGKTDFDAAALRLFAERRVFLHDHTAPHTLSAAARNDLIADGKGNYYVGIAWREPEHDAGLDS
jgi:ribosomal protein S21